MTIFDYVLVLVGVIDMVCVASVCLGVPHKQCEGPAK